ncbi:MAG: choice-of-anchor D domain-containing protein, partial [Verrucomicrobiaceae bacterium]
PLGTGNKFLAIHSGGGASHSIALVARSQAPDVLTIDPATGPRHGGTPVTIKGVNFTGATGVTIGGSPAADVVLVDSITITATTPAGVAGPAAVQVTSPTGTGPTNSIFSYVLPHIEVTADSTPITSGDSTPSSVDHTDFGNQLLLSDAARHGFTISNSGATALNLSGSPRVAITGAHATDFTVSRQPSTVVDVGETSGFEIAFKPTAPGPRMATVTIANDDPSANPFTFAISGYASLATLRSQVITFTPPTIAYIGQSPLTLAASASSNLPVGLVVSGPATLSGNALTLTGTGTVTIFAYQAGGSNYAAAVPVTRTITVKEAPTVMTLIDLAQTYDGTPKAVSTLGATGVVTITYKVGAVETASAPSASGSYPVKAIAGGITKTGTLIINKAVLTVKPEDKRKFASQSNPTLTYTVTGFAGSDTSGVIGKLPVLATTANPTSVGGLFPITASGASAANYTFNYQVGTMVVETFAGGYESLLIGPSLTPVGKVELLVAINNKTYTGKLYVTNEAVALPLAGTLSLDAANGLATATAGVVKNNAVYAATFQLPQVGAVHASVLKDGQALGSAVDGRKLLSLPAGRGVSYAGAHTAVLIASDPSIGSLPTAPGWATATIGPSGTLVLAGKLGDGTAVASSLAADDAIDPGYRCWMQPYLAARGDSYLAGRFSLAAHPVVLNRRYLSAADMVWQKVGRSSDATYRVGFGPGVTTLSIDPWLPPVGATTLAVRLNAGGTLALAHESPGSDSEASIPRSAVLGTNTLAVPSASNPRKWKTSLNIGNGTYTGSFELVDGPIRRIVPFAGVFRQSDPNLGLPVAFGHYLLPPLSGTEKLTGGMTFTR